MHPVLWAWLTLDHWKRDVNEWKALGIKYQSVIHLFLSQSHIIFSSPAFEQVFPRVVYSEQRREKRSCMAVSLRDRDAASDASLLTGSTVTDDLRLFTTAERQRVYTINILTQQLCRHINIATKTVSKELV